jgi:hypothetical protein
MAKRILKFKSRNLFGENRKEEKRRLIDQKVKAILRGESIEKINQISSAQGTTKEQRMKRDRILKRSNLEGQKTPTIKRRLQFL